MENEDSLAEEARDQVEEIGKADILVGIPSFNNEKTIGHVVRAVQYGLAKYFPKFRSVVMNSDSGSTDKTGQIVKETSIYPDLDTILIEHPVRPARSLSTPYHGIPGKGSAFKAIFETAKLLKVRACVVVDSDLRSINPEWIELLAGPIVIKGYDYVSPLYLRHKYDATITNSIVYPLTRALYGLRVRQPIGGDFGFAGRLVKSFLGKNVWGMDVARYGIDIWMTTTAINEGYKVCQSFLGAKIHDAKDPGKDLGPMFKQVVGTLFRLMWDYESHWKQVIHAKPTAVYGFHSEASPEPVAINRKLLIDKFRKGLMENHDYWLSFLPPARVRQLEKVADFPMDRFSFSRELWVKTVYDFAVAYRQRKNAPSEVRDRLVESLVPIYFGRTASFVIETKDMPTYEADEIIERLCDKFEKLKPYLLQRWNSMVNNEE
jgi:glycosyltransferase involved in cell wall biosynthesis